jgi:hypothetical protein
LLAYWITWEPWVWFLSGSLGGSCLQIVHNPPGLWGGIKEPGRESSSMGSRLRMLETLSPLRQGVMLNYTQGKTFSLLKIQRVLFQAHCLVDAYYCFRSRDVDVKV